MENELLNEMIGLYKEGEKKDEIDLNFIFKVDKMLNKIKNSGKGYIQEIIEKEEDFLSTNLILLMKKEHDEKKEDLKESEGNLRKFPDLVFEELNNLEENLHESKAKKVKGKNFKDISSKDRYTLDKQKKNNKNNFYNTGQNKFQKFQQKHNFNKNNQQENEDEDGDEEKQKNGFVSGLDVYKSKNKKNFKKGVYKNTYQNYNQKNNQKYNQKYNQNYSQNFKKKKKKNFSNNLLLKIYMDKKGEGEYEEEESEPENNQRYNNKRNNYPKNNYSKRNNEKKRNSNESNNYSSKANSGPSDNIVKIAHKGLFRSSPKFSKKKKKFSPPFRNRKKEENNNEEKPKTEIQQFAEQEGLNLKLVEQIEHEILDKKPLTTWEDIAGLQCIKDIIYENIIYPCSRPDIFNGLRQPSKGILLFGPPGTGKTMIGRAIAGQLKSTFFSISASSLMSKWIGESEQLIKTLFRIAIFLQPSVIFVDEVDSLLSVRSDGEQDHTIRVKTEFFSQLDGARSEETDRILVIGTTNRPENIDEAARRRFTRRLYVPLPHKEARKELIKCNIEKERKRNFVINLNEEEIDIVVKKSKGYSCADIYQLLKEASMIPVRDLIKKCGKKSEDWKKDEMRPANINDFLQALETVKTSVNPSEIVRYKIWNDEFGFSKFTEEED